MTEIIEDTDKISVKFKDSVLVKVSDHTKYNMVNIVTNDKIEKNESVDLVETDKVKEDYVKNKKKII